MKVTKAQAQANRAHIVETASELFRERGYDGVGIADLMAAAGFTHGGFYKHFGSKADLMAEAAACGISQTVAMTEGSGPGEFLQQYLSRQHRDAPGQGCTMAALCSDAARQPESVKEVFATGLERLLAALSPDVTGNEAMSREARARNISVIAHAVGALVLSRACPDDSPLADEILETCRSAIQSHSSARPER
ncbi:TetR family transcriptional regulator [Pseudomonas sp. RW407]|uniref:TetR/AcrR family transcriptional regulator n=1 Tax=Pseudomonas sp. RW407 TaxID=2202894 RepID=UPI000D6FA860|nr:TetR family transcriptional regulator [Pseudomonas sp. RW407]PWU31019.1 TetR family transcriptional regulator [Pseudomonas sp. RW407]